jgi:hypothetical protein
MQRLKLLYICGAGRSGSTILDRAIGQVSGFFSLGEFHSMWRRLPQDGWLCGCGEVLKRCNFWKPVLHETFGDDSQIAHHAKVYENPGGDRMRYVPLLLLPGAKWLLSRHLRRNGDGLSRLYRTIQANTGCRVIVDSSKLPTYGFVLSQLSGIDLYVVHLVRDPRGVAYSWRRKKMRSDRVQNGGKPEDMGHMSAGSASLLWDSINLATERLWRSRSDRYLLVRYEDFIADPGRELERICRMLHERVTDFSFLKDGAVSFKPDHTVAGNPGRIEQGVVRVKPDDEWRGKLPGLNRAAVTALTWPLLRRYGYTGKGGERVCHEIE